MSFWTGIADYLGFKPIDDVTDFFQDALSLVSMGGYRADENRFDVPFAAGSVFGGSVGDVQAVYDQLSDYGVEDYFNDLLQTDQEAALRQAVANEDAAVNSWKRSEESAENALNRARQLRQTYYQDLMHSLESAGLNPVLAAQGGFGGVSSSAPQGTSQASSSQKAEGLNAANLLQAIAAILSGAGSLIGNLNPLKGLTKINSKGEVSTTSYSYGKR